MVSSTDPSTTRVPRADLAIGLELPQDRLPVREDHCTLSGTLAIREANLGTVILLPLDDLFLAGSTWYHAPTAQAQCPSAPCAASATPGPI